MSTSKQSTEIATATQPLSDQSDIVHTSTLQRQDPAIAADEHLKSLARAMGRQAARRYLNRGYSIVEIAMVLVLGALIIGALLYVDILHSGSR